MCHTIDLCSRAASHVCYSTFFLLKVPENSDGLEIVAKSMLWYAIEQSSFVLEV